MRLERKDQGRWTTSERPVITAFPGHWEETDLMWLYSKRLVIVGLRF